MHAIFIILFFVNAKVLCISIPFHYFCLRQIFKSVRLTTQGIRNQISLGLKLESLTNLSVLIFVKYNASLSSHVIANINSCGFFPLLFE